MRSWELGLREERESLKGTIVKQHCKVTIVRDPLKGNHCKKTTVRAELQGNHNKGATITHGKQKRACLKEDLNLH